MFRTIVAMPMAGPKGSKYAYFVSHSLTLDWEEWYVPQSSESAQLWKDLAIVNLGNSMKRILLVEDREDDVLLLQMAIKDAPQTLAMEVVTDGEQAIQFLSRVQSTALTKDSQIPELVLVDIKLPKVDGHEVVKWVRQRPEFTAMPIIMLTSSDRRDDILKALSLGANSYLVKTGDMAKFRESLLLLLKYWFEVNQKLPER
jgi:CheY-like chemotaxis protein